MRHNLLDDELLARGAPLLATLVRRGQRRNQLGQRDQPVEMKRDAPAGDDHERIGRHRIRPLRGERDQLALARADIHPSRSPVMPSLDELELLPGPWMKRMRHPHPRQIRQTSA